MEPESSINIKIKTLNNDIHQILVDKNAKVIDLKKIIEDIIKVPVVRQRLIYKAKFLADTDNLLDHKLEEGCVVQLVATTLSTTSSQSSSYPNPGEAARVEQLRARNRFYQRHRYLQKRMNGFRINQPQALEVLQQSKYTIEQLLASLNRNPQESNEPFLFKHRKLIVGTWVDVKDAVGQWYEAQVLNTNGDYVLVQYNGWNERWNQWIKASSSRIMPFRSQTVQNTYSLYMSPFPQEQRMLEKQQNPNFQTNLTDFMQQLSVVIDRLNCLLKQCQQCSQMNFYIPKDRTQSQFLEPDTKQQKWQKSQIQKSEQKISQKQIIQTPTKEPFQNINDNLSNKCDDNMSNKGDNDNISNKSFKSKRSQGLVDTLSMKSLKTDDKPTIFFDLEAKSVRSMKSEINSKHTYYLNHQLYPENIKQEEYSELQDQDSYQEVRKNMKKQSFKDMISKRENQRQMKASQLAPLLDRMGRIMIDLAPHVAMIGNTDQLSSYQNLSIVTNQGSLQSRIVGYLRSQNHIPQQEEQTFIQQQYCDFQVPIMLTPIEIYALNQVQSQTAGIVNQQNDT